MYFIVKVKRWKMYCKWSPRETSKSFPLESIYKLKISLFTFCFLGIEVVFTRIRSFVVWWQIRHGIRKHKTFCALRSHQETILTVNTDWGSRELGERPRTPQIIWLIKCFLLESTEERLCLRTRRDWNFPDSFCRFQSRPTRQCTTATRTSGVFNVKENRLYSQ